MYVPLRTIETKYIYSKLITFYFLSPLAAILWSLITAKFKIPLKVVHIGLGIVPGDRSFFHKNERNDQEWSIRSKKKEGTKFLKKVETICKGTERKYLNV